MLSWKERVVRVLRWSERYTKTDMLYLTRGGFWSIVGQGSAALLSFILAIAMARFVPKEVYGDYKYILAIISILTTFSLTGAGTAVLQSVARGYVGALSEGFWANLRWSFIVFLGAFALGAYYLFHGNTELGLGVLIGGCISPFLASFNLYISLLSGKKDFSTLAWYSDFITNIIPTITLIIVAYVAPQPLSLLIAYFFANLIAAAYAYWRSALRHSAMQGAKDPEMVSYSKHLSIMGVLNGIASNIDQIFLFHFVGPIQLAIYNFATAIPDQAKGPIKNLDQMMQIQFATRSTEEIHREMKNKMFWLFLFSIVLIVIYILIAPFIYKIFFPKYIDAIFYSQLYALSYLGTLFIPSGSYFSAKKKVKEQYISNLLVSVFRIIALFVGVLYWSLMGLIFAMIIIRVLGSLLGYILYLLNKFDTAAVN